MMAKRFGFGEYVYQLDVDWGRLPEGWSYVDAVGMVVDSQDRVYVFNRGAHPIIVFDRNGTLLGTWGEGIFPVPHGLQVGPDGSIYCVDCGNHTLRKFTPEGKLLLMIGMPGKKSDTGYDGDPDRIRPAGPFNAPTNCAIAADGSIFVTDGYGNCRVHHFSADGKLLHSWGEPGVGPGQFRLVHGIGIAGDGTLYVGDRINNRVQKFSPSGEYVGEWSDVRRPDEIFAHSNGHFFVAELGWPDEELTPASVGARVTIRNAEGHILSGWDDGGAPGAPGNIAAPHGITVDSHGDLYVGEVANATRISTGLLKTCHVVQKFIRVH